MSFLLKTDGHYRKDIMNMLYPMNDWGLVLLEPDENQIAEAEALGFEKITPAKGACNQIYMDESGEYINPDEPFWMCELSQPGLFDGAGYDEVSDIRYDFPDVDIEAVLGITVNEMLAKVNVVAER